MSSKNLSFFTAIVALAGFLFGFDTVVISGANLPIKELWHTSPWFHGMFIMSMALWGTVAGALGGGILRSNPWPIFAFFAAFMVLQLLWVLLVMPETKGKTLEQLGTELSNKM
jgi:hypothetical protein